MLRKTVLATVVVGAGLGAMTGSALATTHHHGDDAKGCSNSVRAQSENGAGRTLGDTDGGDQAVDASNLCDIANGNIVGSGNNTAGGDIRNGDLTDITRTSTDTNTENTTTNGTGAGAGAGGLGGLDGILDAIFGA